MKNYYYKQVSRNLRGHTFDINLFFLKLKVNCLYSFFFTIIWVIRYSIYKIYLYINNEIKHYYIKNIEISSNDHLFVEDNIFRSNYISDHFFEWLAGVIDGDGYFNLSKGGTARLTITMDLRDKKALYEIKHKLGGSSKRTQTLML